MNAFLRACVLHLAGFLQGYTIQGPKLGKGATQKAGSFLYQLITKAMLRDRLRGQPGLVHSATAILYPGDSSCAR